MKNFDLIKALGHALKEKDKTCANKIYFLRPETIRKISELESLLNGAQAKIDFDAISNSIEICLTDYVFDSCVNKMKRIFSITDLFVIDADSDGKVHIEMKILNASEIIGG